MRYLQVPAKVIGALILMVQIKILSKEFHSRFFLKVNLTEDLEVADIGYGIGHNILRVEFEKMEDIFEEL